MTHNKKTILKKDIVVVFMVPILATALCLIFKTNLLLTTLLFYAPLALYLSYKTQHLIKKTLLFSLVVSIPYNMLDYLGVLDKSWHVTTIFPSRVLGSVPYEDTLWFFLFVFTTIMFYEHFLDHVKHHLFNPKMKYLLALILLGYLFFFIFYHISPSLLTIPYYYFWIGSILFFIPTLVILIMYPKLIAKYAVTGAYFFIHSFLFEITSLQLHNWSFPGIHFIGWVQIFGYSFPFEELFFFIIFCSLGVITFFETFDVENIS